MMIHIGNVCLEFPNNKLRTNDNANAKRESINKMMNGFPCKVLHGKSFIILLIVIQMKLAKNYFEDTQKETNDPN